MNHFGCSPFSLDAGFLSCTHLSTHLISIMTRPNRFFSVFWLVPIGFLVVQFIHARSQECGLGMAVRLKFQIVWCVC